MQHRYVPLNIRHPADLVFSRVTDQAGRLFMEWNLIEGRHVMIVTTAEPSSPQEGMVTAVRDGYLAIASGLNTYSGNKLVAKDDIYYLYVQRDVTNDELHRWLKRKQIIADMANRK